jgi:ribosome-associated translation inhibitor RaiA/cold shock CspA family protein
MPQVPLQVTFRHMPHSDAVETLVRDKVEKLEEFYPALISCRVVIEKEALHHQQGQRFNVRLDLHVPGHEFATTREHHEDFDVAIRDAFDVAKRWLEDEVLVADGRFGFIEKADGGELYFSADNVVDPSFDALEPGMKVQFIEDFGAEEGPQAKRVSVGRHSAG